MSVLSGAPREPAATPARVPPTRWQSIRILAGMDLTALSRSWLVLGFLAVSALVTLIQLKGMASQETVASGMLEAVYATYLLIWMHAVIFIGGSALSRESDCLGEAILSRGVTRGEYFTGKLLSRGLAVGLVVAGVLLPASLWAIRQDELVRSDDGSVTTHSWGTKIEAWEPHRVYAPTEGTLAEVALREGERVDTGVALARLDDRELFDEFETRRRAEENARRTLENARRRHEKSKRAISSAEDAVETARRALRAAQVQTRVERGDREADVRARLRDLQDARTNEGIEANAVANAEHDLADARDGARAARQRLARTVVTSPITGYVTEVEVESGQDVTRGTHLGTIAPLDDYQVKVPILEFETFQRLREGLPAYVTVRHGSEFRGTVERLSSTTQEDRFGRNTNFVVVRFSGDGKLGLLGLTADVKVSLPPPTEEKAKLAGALLNTFTGHGDDDLETRTTSVTWDWMGIALAKVLGCAFLLVSLALLAASLFRKPLVAILGVTGLWHISNLLFDFAGLPELSYVEMIRTLDKVLGGVASRGDELVTLGWLYGIAAAVALLGVLVFVRRDPPR